MKLKEFFTVYKNVDLDRLVYEIKQILRNELPLLKEEKTKSGLELTYKLADDDEENLTIRVSKSNGAIYTQIWYLDIYDWEDENPEIIYYKERIHRIIREICNRTSPIIGFGGFPEYWPPTSEILNKVQKTEIPKVKNISPKPGEPKDLIIGGDIMYFLSNTYLKKYKIDIEKIKPLQLQKTQNGIIIPISKLIEKSLKGSSDQKWLQDYYSAWEYLRRKFTEKE